MSNPTESEMNLALCEKLGWKYDVSDPTAAFLTKAYPEQMISPVTGKVEVIPNHFSPDASGLWACHEAENGLTDEQWVTFCKRLSEVTGRGMHSITWWNDRLIISATAPQRARALYLTLCQP